MDGDSLLVSILQEISALSWLTDAVVLVVVFGAAITTTLPMGRRFLLTRASRSSALPIPRELERMVLAPQSRRVWGFAVGAFAGVGASTLYAGWIGSDRGGPSTFLLVGGAAVGGTVGTAIAGLIGVVNKVAHRDDEVRVAFAHRRGLSDFAPRALQVAARTAVGLAILFIIVLLVANTLNELRLLFFPSLFSPLIVMTTLAVVELAAFEIGGRIIIGRSQVTTSELELAWNDVVRSSAVRDLLVAATVFGVYALLAGLGEFALNAAGAVGLLRSDVGV